MHEVVIVAAKRTPIGSFNGVFASLPAVRLGAAAIKGVLEQAQAAPADVCEVLMGMVLQGGAGQAPARQAAIYAGIPHSVGCTTVHKVCGSGLKSVMLAAQAIRLGDSDTVIAGGMESMTNAPYYLFQARQGYRMGDGKLVDGMVFDGLWDPYGDMHMGMCGEICAAEMKITRGQQDEFTMLSYQRALEAMKAGKFTDEIAPVGIPQKGGDPLLVSEDEEPKKVKFDKIPTLKPAFKKDGTITAANASKINDGAAALILMSTEEAKKRGLKPLAKVHGYGCFAQAPEWFTTAPAEAIRKAVAKTIKADGKPLTIEDVDLFEINEAFAVVALANIQLLSISADKVNVNGGAVALGHPIGASGARILTTLIYALADRNKKWGVAGICLGGGEAVAVVVERL